MALRFLQGLTPNGVRVDHGRPDIAVAEQFLNGPYVIIGLQ